MFVINYLIVVNYENNKATNFKFKFFFKGQSYIIICEITNKNEC